MQTQSMLQQAGLDRHESEVYLSLIRLGEATAGQLAQSSGVPRTYTYKILESLEDKGFIQERDARGIRRYGITDFEAPKRYIEQQQLSLYRVQQQAQSLSAHLENIANPEAPTAVSETLKDQQGREEFWLLMHSTITREIWVINPPLWWADPQQHQEVKKWEKYRIKQHIWEKRFLTKQHLFPEAPFTEEKRIQNPQPGERSLFLIDHYQVQVTNWEPFRALRVESQQMVELYQHLLQ